MSNKVGQTDEYNNVSGTAKAGVYKSRNQLIQEFCDWIPGAAVPQRDMTRIGEVDSICQTAHQFKDHNRGCMVFEHDVCSTSSNASHCRNDSFERSAGQDSRVSGSQAKAAVNRRAVEVATPKASAAEVDELMAIAYPSAKASPSRREEPWRSGAKAKAQPKKKPVSDTCKKGIAKAHAFAISALEHAESILDTLGEASLSQVQGAIPKIDLDDLAASMLAAHQEAERAMEVHAAGEGENPTATLASLKAKLANLKASSNLVDATIDRLCARFGIERPALVKD
jgi:hypothetical protein